MLRQALQEVLDKGLKQLIIITVPTSVRTWRILSRRIIAVLHSLQDMSVQQSSACMAGWTLLCPCAL